MGQGLSCRDDIYITPKFHLRVHKSSPLYLIPIKLNAVHNLTQHLPQTHSNTALPSKVMLLFEVFRQKFYMHFSFPHTFYKGKGKVVPVLN
jgi:hypothetical protein